ncbi:MAG: DNA-3-methyladenine glycosylase family protein [Acidimicrobiia bacterium]
MSLRSIPVPFPIDLAKTLFPLCRGAGDPTMRIGLADAYRAMRTPDGPATVHVRSIGYDISMQAWGPGADWALASVPGLVGALDDASGFQPQHHVIDELWRRHKDVRITRTGVVMQSLIPAILEQKVTGMEARRAYRSMVMATSEPAPGDVGLYLPPDPARLAETPYFAFHPWGVERRRAETVRAACEQASRLEAGTTLTLDQANARLLAIRGVGPWTAAEVARTALGDADAISVGDFHLPNVVCWALAREPRGTDERMLELLEPYRGHRGRVQALLEAGSISAPAFGPRMEVHSIERI